MARGTWSKNYWVAITPPGKPIQLEERQALDRDIVAEPIVGWRVWQVAMPQELRLDRAELRRMAEVMYDGGNPFEDALQPYLSSVAGAAFRWSDKTEARCNQNGDHHERVPVRGCGCGLWAVHTRDQVDEILERYHMSGRYPLVYGEVQLWGRVIEHRLGYRAQYARPVGPLYTRDGFAEEEILELAAAYGCGVIGERDPASPLEIAARAGLIQRGLPVASAGPLPNPNIPGSYSSSYSNHMHLGTAPAHSHVYQQQFGSVIAKYQKQAAALASAPSAHLELHRAAPRLHRLHRRNRRLRAVQAGAITACFAMATVNIVVTATGTGTLFNASAIVPAALAGLLLLRRLGR